MMELRYLEVDWDCLKISNDLKKNLKIDFHQGIYNSRESKITYKKEIVFLTSLFLH